MTKTIDTTAAIVAVAGKENPCREGTERHERVQAVIKSKRVELALKNGAKLSTVRFCLDAGLVRLGAAAKRAAAPKGVAA